MASLATTSSLCSAASSRPWFGNRPCSKTGHIRLKMKDSHPVKVSSSYDHDNHDGKLVDDNMIVLRMRIHDIEMSSETSDRDETPSDWKEWEKRCYACYKSDVYVGIGLLQSQLMKTRPCLALGMLALVTLSVPITAAASMSSMLDILKQMLLANGIQI